MKKIYNNPTVCIMQIDINDIVTASRGYDSEDNWVNDIFNE